MKLTEERLRKIIREELGDPAAVADRMEGARIARAGQGMRDSVFVITLDDGSQVTFQATRNGLEVELS